jgi:hypothetical protein
LWALAALALAHRALRGQKFTTSAWTVLSLWLLLLVSELRIMNQVRCSFVVVATLLVVSCSTHQMCRKHGQAGITVSLGLMRMWALQIDRSVRLPDTLGPCALLCAPAAAAAAFLQTLLAMLAYAGLFSIPWLYSKFRPVIDTVVYDTLHLLTLLVVHAERWAYGLAALAAALVWQLMSSEDGSGSLIVQGSAAALAGLAVLVWRVAVAET